MMSLKSDVKIAVLTPQIVLAVIIVQSIYSDLKLPFVITSLTDGKHMPRSKHYVGGAFDIRTNNIGNSTVNSVLKLIRESLTSDFDVVRHSTHIHVEYDPKG